MKEKATLSQIKLLPIVRRKLFVEATLAEELQWAVFEQNGPELWARARTQAHDYLTTLFRSGILVGSKPEQAFFVRCDETTMTQNDIDSGRLVVLVGFAFVKPAEFEIIRIGQWTADAEK